MFCTYLLFIFLMFNTISAVFNISKIVFNIIFLKLIACNFNYNFFILQIKLIHLQCKSADVNKIFVPLQNLIEIH